MGPSCVLEPFYSTFFQLPDSLSSKSQLVSNFFERQRTVHVNSKIVFNNHRLPLRDCIQHPLDLFSERLLHDLGLGIQGLGILYLAEIKSESMTERVTCFLRNQKPDGNPDLNRQTSLKIR